MFIRVGDHKETVPALVLVPNLLTTLALCCGLASLHFSLLKDWDKALAAIVLSGIFDVLDGAVARLLRVSSRFGAVLDSLSDFLAFGVAPALILQQWLLVPAATNGTDKPAKWLVTLSLVAVMTFAVCAALRLARFTSALDKPATLVPSTPLPIKKPGMFFVGMPTPAGAGVVLIPAFLLASDEVPEVQHVPQWVIAAWTIGVALLMVSRIPMFALKGVRVSRAWTAPLLVLVVVLAALMLREPWLVLAGIAVFYCATIPWAMVLHRRVRARDAAATSAATTTPPGA